ncbi:MAG: hypothetical protein WCK49_04340 [Myxococcaceae bacterium]
MFRSSLALFLLLHGSFLNAALTTKDGWAIFSPDPHLAQDQDALPPYASYQTLIRLGENAHHYWKLHSSPNDLAEGLDQIFSPVTPSFISKIIDEILESDELLEEITKASYKNVTGFLKIVIAQGGKNSWKLRLHIWEQGEKEYPHSHKWDFFSKILTGYLIQDIYVKTAENTGSDDYKICEPVSLMPLLPTGEKACPCRDNYTLKEKEMSDLLSSRTYLKHKSRDTIGTGESYFMANDLVHTISPGKHAISFVFTSQQVTPNSAVFVPSRANSNDLNKYAPSVSKEELIIEMMLVKKVLSRFRLSNKYLPELVHPTHRYFNRNGGLLRQQNWRLSLPPASEPGPRVAQLSDEEKKECEVRPDSFGNIEIGNKQIDSRKKYLFVLVDNKMHASPKDFSHQADRLVCHTSFTDYAPVDAAGLLRFDENGNLVELEAYSGHYEPSVSSMLSAYQYLESIGVNVAKIKIVNFQDKTESDFHAKR